MRATNSGPRTRWSVRTGTGQYLASISRKKPASASWPKVDVRKIQRLSIFAAFISLLLLLLLLLLLFSCSVGVSHTILYFAASPGTGLVSWMVLVRGSIRRLALSLLSLKYPIEVYDTDCEVSPRVLFCGFSRESTSLMRSVSRMGCLVHLKGRNCGDHWKRRWLGPTLNYWDEERGKYPRICWSRHHTRTGLYGHAQDHSRVFPRDGL